MKLKEKVLNFLQQRKYWILLLIALPLIVFIIWRVSGGKQSEAQEAGKGQSGFNMTLPDANVKEDNRLDKMSYYDKATSDSAKLKEQMKNDPYYKQQAFLQSGEHTDTGNSIMSFNNNNPVNTPPYSVHTYADPNEAKVYGKLEKLNSALNKAAAPQRKSTDYPAYAPAGNASVNTADVNRLEKMMHTMNQKEGEDPEMQQLSGMLEKIMDIQHPDRVQEKTRQTSAERKGQVFAVSAKGGFNPVSIIDNSRSRLTKTTSTSQQNGFYSSEDVQAAEDEPNAVEAVIQQTQTLVNGSTVKLRLVNDIYINGSLIPKDNFLFGTASLNGERLSIKISSIRYKNSLFPVELLVYDMDGLDGIYIPGAISRDVAKQSADRSLQEVGLNSLNPSLSVQAASAGIEAAKSLVSKKVKLVKVTVKAGYKVLLRDEKQKQGN